MKSQLRKHFLKIRKNIIDRDKQSKLISDLLKNSSQYKSAKQILLYISTPEEVSTSEILEDALKSKQVFIPFIKKLSIGKIDSVKNLIPIRVGKNIYFEPNKSKASNNIDLAIIPGLAFDHVGNRLGQGSGWYDKFLTKKSSTYKIGLAFNEQITNSIPINQKDIKMDLVIYPSIQDL